MSSAGLLRVGSISLADLEASNELIARNSAKLHEPPETMVWLVPLIDHALRGGVRTIFTFAEYLSKTYGTMNTFVFCTLSDQAKPLTDLAESITEHFPQTRFVVQLHRHFVDDIRDLGWSDAAVCSLWTTAYELVKYNRTGQKVYLVQDFEPLFYEAGSVSGMIEQTYRFGFKIIANSDGVAQAVRKYTKKVYPFTPGVNLEQFQPASPPLLLKPPYRVVFYGRPTNPRNSFDLGIQTFRALKRKMGDAVEIISVGADWDEKNYHLEGVVKNIGLLKSMEEVSELYKSAHIGVVFMMTPHPSYQPLEYMASGCVTATNINESNRWLLNEENSLQMEPIPEVAAERILRLLVDPDRWERIRDGGLSVVKKLRWSDAIKSFERALLD